MIKSDARIELAADKIIKGKIRILRFMELAREVINGVCVSGVSCASSSSCEVLDARAPNEKAHDSIPALVAPRHSTPRVARNEMQIARRFGRMRGEGRESSDETESPLRAFYSEQKLPRRFLAAKTLMSAILTRENVVGSGTEETDHLAHTPSLCIGCVQIFQRSFRMR